MSFYHGNVSTVSKVCSVLRILKIIEGTTRDKSSYE